MIDQIVKAVEVLDSGGIIIFPTDTAFGIGCRIDNEISIKKLFNLRKRPMSLATPVLVSSIDMAKEYGFFSDDVVDKLINQYWPGALTIVVESLVDKVPSLVSGGSSTVGLRMPESVTILEIINRVGVPILG